MKDTKEEGWKEYRKKETIKARYSSDKNMIVKINFDEYIKEQNHLHLETIDKNHYKCLKKEFLNQYDLIEEKE